MKIVLLLQTRLGGTLQGFPGTHFENCHDGRLVRCRDVLGGGETQRPLNFSLRIHLSWTNELKKHIFKLQLHKEEVSSAPLLSILRYGVCQNRGPCWTSWKALGLPWACWPRVGLWWHPLPSSPHPSKSGISLTLRSRAPPPRFWTALASLLCPTMGATFTSPKSGTKTKSPSGIWQKVCISTVSLCGWALSPVLVSLGRCNRTLSIRVVETRKFAVADWSLLIMKALEKPWNEHFYDPFFFFFLIERKGEGER